MSLIAAGLLAACGVLALLAGVAGMVRFREVLERAHALRAGTAFGGTLVLLALAMASDSVATALKLLLLALALGAGSTFATFWIAGEQRAEEGREP